MRFALVKKTLKVNGLMSLLLLMALAFAVSISAQIDSKKNDADLLKTGEEPADLSEENFLEIDLDIQPTDVLVVDVHGESNLSKTVEVDKKGFINYPLIGQVKVEGLSKEEAEDRIHALFEKDYLVNPLIAVDKVVRQKEEEEEEPADMSTYIILGEVKKPGTYEFDPEEGKMTLLKAISIAGGFSPIANKGKIKMLRRDGVETEAFIINFKDIVKGERPDEELQNEDLIVVAESLL